MAPLKSTMPGTSEDLLIQSGTRSIMGSIGTREVERGSSFAEACWMHRRMLWRLVWRAFLLVSIVVFLLPKMWVSDARLMPPEQSSTSGLAAMLSSKAGDSLPAGLADIISPKSSEGAMFIAVLRSETVENRLIDSFNLRRVYYVSTYKQAREILENRTSIVDDRRSGIISLAVEDRNPIRARDLCAAYIDQLNRLVAELSTSSARRERIFLEGRLKEVRSELQEAEQELSQFSSKHSTLDVSEQGKAMLQSAGTLQGELIAAQSELQGLQTIYSDNNVRVRALRAKVSELERALEKGVSGGTPAEQASQLYPSLRQLPILGATYADLYRQTKIEATVFEILTKEYEMARVEEAKEIPTVRVLDTPLVPEKKSSPKRLQLIFAGTTLALLGGMAWLAFRRAWLRGESADPNRLLLQEIIRSCKMKTRVLLKYWPLRRETRI
jgi:capsule polysaccharide export protein KpsE/RkpR